MWNKSIPKRAFSLSAWTTVFIMIFVALKMLLSEVVGSPLEIVGRLFIIVSVLLIGFWVFYVGYLYFNPNFDDKDN
ncbi:hypothetical protein GCM10008940_35070 [Microbulbifer agarilyticus]